MNLSAAFTLSIGPRTGTWFRATPPQFYPSSIFQLAYTRRVVSRFSAGANAQPAFEILYLAQAPEIALLETENVYGSLGSTIVNLRSVTLYNVEVRLSRIVDLTDTAVLAALQTNVQELTGNWKVFNTAVFPAPGVAPGTSAPTQQLGAALFASGVEGFITPSAKHPNAVSLVVFPENLLPGSFVLHTDPHTGQTYQI